MEHTTIAISREPTIPVMFISTYVVAYKCNRYPSITLSME